MMMTPVFNAESGAAGVGKCSFSDSPSTCDHTYHPSRRPQSAGRQLNNFVTDAPIVVSVNESRYVSRLCLPTRKSNIKIVCYVRSLLLCEFFILFDFRFFVSSRKLPVCVILMAFF